MMFKYFSYETVLISEKYNCHLSDIEQIAALKTSPAVIFTPYNEFVTIVIINAPSLHINQYKFYYFHIL